MKMFYFSDLCVRLRRNLIISATLLFVILYFEIKITKVVTAGILLGGLTTEVVLHVLFAIVVYHIFAFFLRANEEFTEWRLSLTDTEETMITGPVASRIVTLSDRFVRNEGVLIKILENLKSFAAKKDPIAESPVQFLLTLTPREVLDMKETWKYVKVYGRSLENFPRNARLRFWGWEIGVASFISIIAVVSYVQYFTQ